MHLSSVSERLREVAARGTVPKKESDLTDVRQFSERELDLMMIMFHGCDMRELIVALLQHPGASQLLAETAFDDKVCLGL
jgi:hypothetical protein